jgi:hypothetical protein
MRRQPPSMRAALAADALALDEALIEQRRQP